jgi:hypothetical protein
MGHLALFLQKSFLENCPPGWECSYEKRLLSKHQEALLGYSPRADVLLSKTDGSLHLWIEFEISRADPVANHAKFATSHIFFPWQETDIFLSMVSSHVSRGRSNLAANTIWLMRRLGLHAYQTNLLPHYDPQSIYRLNYLSYDELSVERLPINSEIERAITITKPLNKVAEQTLYYAANLMEVMHNVAQWNLDIRNPSMQSIWGKRRITYFVYNPYTKEFAPSKFCAYIAAEKLATVNESIVSGATMTIPLYAEIPRDERIFDGRAARLHLERHLAMQLVNLVEDSDLLNAFKAWINSYQDFITIPDDGVFILVPPEWY